MTGEEMLSSYKEGRLSTEELLYTLQNLNPEHGDKMPLSEGQKGLWMIEKISPESGIYNIPICMRIRKSLDIKLLEQAFHYIRRQYPILKTVIIEEEGVPYQSIEKSQSFSIHTENVQEFGQLKLKAHIKKIAKMPFSLNRGQLMRVHVFQVKEDEQILLINIHHIIFDGISIELLIQPLFRNYMQLVRGIEPECEELSADYYDFVKWESEMMKGSSGKFHQEYWKNQLSGNLPVLVLPEDYKRSTARTGEGETQTQYFSAKLMKKIRNFCRERQISVPTYFMAVFQIMLYQYSNLEDIIVGMASKGRPSEQFDSLIGFFINMIPVRCKISPEQKFCEFIRDVQLTMLDGIDHADYPFPAIVSELGQPRDIGSSPIFQVGFFYQNFISADVMTNLNHNLNDFSVEFVEEIHQEGEYELTLEVFEREEELQINMKYNPELYKASSIQRMNEGLIKLAEEGIRSPKQCIKDYPMLSAEEEKTVVHDWNLTQKEYEQNKCVYEIFQEQAKKTPEAVAVVYEEDSMTYRELDEKSTELAIYLQRRGVGSDDLVGICVERSLYMIVGLLGILKAGGAYIPFDPDYPKQRLKYMADNSEVSIVITQGFLIDKINELTSEKVQIIPLDTHWKLIEDERKSEPSVLYKKAGSEHLAYVLYTSGSTGNPKGVMISHRALTNFLLSMGEEPGLSGEDRLLAVTTYCFDIAVLELFLPLIKGAKCYICSSEKQKNIEKLRAELKRTRPTIMQATPATWTALFLIGWKNEEGVKVLCGGEALPESLRQSFAQTNTVLWNMFGPTETTIWSTVKRIGKKDAITIGKPIANTQLYILNKYMRPVPINVPGELYIGGDGLARGYLHMPELTAEKFVENPFGGRSKLYKTGDLARWLDTGEVEFLGRIDNQIKMNGFRIELGEIEAKLTMHPKIQECAVIISEYNGTKQLRAFYVCVKEYRNQVDKKELRVFLKEALPSHMIPGMLMELDVIPLTPNGKINRLELANIKAVKQQSKKREDSQADLEKIVLQIWKDVIGIEEIEVEDGFFESGGNSITAVVAAERMSKRLGCDIPVTAVFEYANVKRLSAHISEIIEKPTTAVRELEILKESDSAAESENDSFPFYYDDSVAIIGMSCQFPGADNLHQFWNNLVEGRESIRFLSSAELQNLNVPEEISNHPAYVPVQATIEGKARFDPEFFRLSPKDAEFMDPQMRLLLMHSWKAVEDAGYRSEEIPRTAVYMSSSNNGYQKKSAAREANIIEKSDDYVSWLLNQAGTIPTIISYQLGLKGPSYSIHSNCSSSLVGLQSAQKSIQSGEVEYALVGASTIHSLFNAGYVHVSGLNFSGNGHIKAFDSEADGMIGGEGVGVILLKNARKAAEDGDHIYSILRGIHINNDGADKVGFYAPGIKGQSEVIEKVLEATNIDPKTIDYVEAHGTGTKLGDPIEVRALQNIYEKYTSKKQFCGIGSVKTNIGHLDTAAGLAGCMKVALSLYHGCLPKTLNYNKANKEIEFNNSPFYVVENTVKLEDRKQPYRAALSSFGIGGTNVHAIFESYRIPGNKNAIIQPEYLIPLSARNEERLKEYTRLLSGYLRQHKMDIDLGDVAYTFQIGRISMEKRVAFLVKDTTDLIQKMEQYVAGKEHIKNCFVENEESDRVSEALLEKYAVDRKWEKIGKLWVQGKKLDWTMLYKGGKTGNRISLPTYPFSEEEYWREESCDCKEKVEKLHPLIDRNTSDFTGQKYTTRFTGQEFFLSDHVINRKKVLAGVVYIELARAAGEITAKEKIQKIKNIVWMSPITVEYPREAEIILVQKENEIEFRVCTSDEADKTIHAQGKMELLPDGTKQSDRSEYIDVKSCIEGCYGYIDHREFYDSDTTSVYQYGETFRPIKEIYYNDREAVSRIKLPVIREDDFIKFTLHPSLLEGCLQTVVGLMRGKVTAFMPFSIEEIEIIETFPKECYVHAMWSEPASEHNRAKKFNIRLLDKQGRILAAIKNYTIRTIKEIPTIESRLEEQRDTVFFYNSWKKVDIHKKTRVSDDNIIVFDNGDELKAIFSVAQQFIYVTNDNEYKSKDQYQELFYDLKGRQMIPEKIVYMLPEFSEAEDMYEQAESVILSIFHLVQALIGEFSIEYIKILFVYKEVEGISLPINQAVIGFINTVQLENPRLSCKLIQIPLQTGVQKEYLLAEFDEEGANEIRYFEDGRYISVLQEDIGDEPVLPIRHGGVFLITGGLGSIGFIVAKYLAGFYNAKLVLTGRSEPDDHKKDRILELERLGAQVQYIKADVSKRKDAENLVSSALKQYREIHGVIHCAGIIHDKLIRNKEDEDMMEVIRPKVQGTLFLDEALQKVKLDFFVLFSSVSCLGNIGQADYAYANSFLNKYADYCESSNPGNRQSRKTISISWPFWKEGGMKLEDENIQYIIAEKGMYPVTNEAGINILEKALMKNRSHVIACYGEKEKIKQNFVLDKAGQDLDRKEEREHNVITNTYTVTDYAEYVGRFLVDTAESLLKIKNIDIDRDMIKYGFDSISNTEFANKINEYYEIDVMPTIFFELEQPTLRSLAASLCEKYNAALSIFYQKQGREYTTKKKVDVDLNMRRERYQEQISAGSDDKIPDKGREIQEAQEDDIAVIGMNGIFPQSENLQEFWDNLMKEENFITEIPKERFDWRAFHDPRIKWGGFMKEVDKFDAEFFGISALEAEVMDPQHRLFLQVAWGTLEDAGYKPSELSGTDTGIFVGIGTQDYSQLIDKHMTNNNPYALTGRTPFMLVNRISSMLNLNGPSEPVDTACSSSLVAVHRAVEAISSGVCGMAIAGGVNVILNPTVHLAFSAAGMLTDSGKCKVFDKEADGTVRSEGVGAILLKKKSEAVRDGDHIYAVIKGSAERHKGKSNSLTAPSANAEADLLVEVYEKANMDPSTVGYIEAHSTGTKIGDPIEINGLKIAFQKLYKKSGITNISPHCAIGSLKANIGHLEAAAGIGAIIKVILAMQYKKILRTLHFNEPNPYISLENSPFYINRESKEWGRIEDSIPRRAGVSAFGFGGVNVHVALEEYMGEPVFLPVSERRPAVIILSARNKERLIERVRLLWSALNEKRYEQKELASIAYTLQTGREELTERLAFTVSSIEELERVLLELLKNDGHIMNVYHGQVQNDKEVITILQNDSAFRTVQDVWISNGEYHKLLSLWVKGLYINWNKLYEEGKPNRISLPVYPFERRSHWLSLKDEPVATEQKNERDVTIKTGQSVLQVISSLLGVEASSIDLHQTVSDLGIDSIILTQILQHLQKTNQSADFEALYNCNTIEDIINLTSRPEGQIIEPLTVTNAPDATNYPELIRLNKANGNRPVFWFHGGFGGVEVYRFIAQNIERPFYGIQARGYMTDQEPLQGIEAMASYYIRMISSIQPEGPYDLGGLSLGGMIAYEVVRQLQESGQEVSSIMMLESIYVNEEMRADWMAIPMLNLKKDRMFRAVNLLLSFSANDSFTLISGEEINKEGSDEEFLEQLIGLAQEKGNTKSSEQLRVSIIQLEKILNILDMSTTFYNVLPLKEPDNVPCYYICNTKGELFGEQEAYFRLIDKGQKYDYRDFSTQWREKMPRLRVINVEAESHLTLLTEPESQRVITALCKKLYERGITD